MSRLFHHHTYQDLLLSIDAIDPVAYAKTRNHLSGDVTMLSPYVTHGVISVNTIARHVIANHGLKASEKFIFQLAWREYFHRVWQARGQDIFTSLRQPQENVTSDELPTAITNASTGIETIDKTIDELQNQHGWMHNHARLWCAFLVCNVANVAWRTGAKWMHYHLLDGDLASNSLSWQWVAGTFSSKRYLANQGNINKYSDASQTGSFLDVDYATIATLDTPDILQNTKPLVLSNTFPDSTQCEKPKPQDKIHLHHIYNLDPTWRADNDGRHILLIEPSVHKDFPLSPKRWAFIEYWAKQNSNIEIFVGEFDELFSEGTAGIDIHYREYPLLSHWQGQQEARDWLFPNTTECYPSFFKFWNKAKRELKTYEI